MNGNISEIGDVGGGPEEFSFLFNNAIDLGIGLTGDKVYGLVKHCTFCNVRCALDDPLKIRWRDLFAPMVVLITASGLQGVQPLVDRTM